MNDFKPVRLRRSPLAWRIYSRDGWYRAIPFWSGDEVCAVGRDLRREYRAGIRRQGGWNPWVPGDRASAE